MSAWRPSNGFPRVLRITQAIACLAFLASGVLENHSPADHGQNRLEPFGFFVPAAAHPRAPQHLETGLEVERPACAACLHSLRTLEVSAVGIVIGRSQSVVRPERCADRLLIEEPNAGNCRGRAPPPHVV